LIFVTLAGNISQLQVEAHLHRVLGRAACAKKGKCKGRFVVQTLCKGNVEDFNSSWSLIASIPHNISPYWTSYPFDPKPKTA
jgi:hypothetical protein